MVRDYELFEQCFCNIEAEKQDSPMAQLQMQPLVGGRKIVPDWCRKTNFYMDKEKARDVLMNQGQLAQGKLAQSKLLAESKLAQSKLLAESKLAQSKLLAESKLAQSKSAQSKLAQSKSAQSKLAQSNSDAESSTTASTPLVAQSIVQPSTPVTSQVTYTSSPLTAGGNRTRENDELFEQIRQGTAEMGKTMVRVCTIATVPKKVRPELEKMRKVS
jgi:hypothetical protein